MNWFRISKKGKVKHLIGVSCEVESCAYHDSEHLCTADHIRVGPHFARATSDTLCASYRRRGHNQS